MTVEMTETKGDIRAGRGEGEGEAAAHAKRPVLADLSSTYRVMLL